MFLVHISRVQLSVRRARLIQILLGTDSCHAAGFAFARHLHSTAQSASAHAHAGGGGGGIVWGGDLGRWEFWVGATWVSAGVVFGVRSGSWGPWGFQPHLCLVGFTPCPLKVIHFSGDLRSARWFFWFGRNRTSIVLGVSPEKRTEVGLRRLFGWSAFWCVSLSEAARRSFLGVYSILVHSRDFPLVGTDSKGRGCYDFQ